MERHQTIKQVLNAEVIAGGFPCQDISHAGKGAGITGERSGLWGAMLRTIRLVRPKYAIVENVAMLLDRGMGEVLGDLASIGYDAEWHSIQANHIGAPHQRERIWIVAYSYENRRGNVLQAEVVNDSKGDFKKKYWPDTEAFISACRNESEYEGDPDSIRICDGFPEVVDMVGSLGNAVLPQIPEIIGRAIMEAEA